MQDLKTDPGVNGQPDASSMVHPQVYQSLQNTFKVSALVKPKVYHSSAQLSKLIKPKFTPNYKRPSPYMHYDFRGLLTTDFQNTIDKTAHNSKKERYAIETQSNGQASQQFNNLQI